MGAAARAGNPTRAVCTTRIPHSLVFPMNRIRFPRSGGAFLAGVLLLACLAGIRAASPSPELTFEDRPISTELKRTTSFAPVAKIASRSVVNV